MLVEKGEERKERKKKTKKGKKKVKSYIKLICCITKSQTVNRVAAGCVKSFVDALLRHNRILKTIELPWSVINS